MSADKLKRHHKFYQIVKMTDGDNEWMNARLLTWKDFFDCHFKRSFALVLIRCGV